MAIGRPRQPQSQISDWAIWKREQRKGGYGKCARCGSTKNLVKDHKDNNKGRTKSGTRVLCTSCHAARTNVIRSRASGTNESTE